MLDHQAIQRKQINLLAHSLDLKNFITKKIKEDKANVKDIS